MHKGYVVVAVSVPDYFWSREPVLPDNLVFPHRTVSTVSFTPVLLGLTCMLRVCLYRKGAMNGKKSGVGNVSFMWWRKPYIVP